MDPRQETHGRKKKEDSVMISLEQTPYFQKILLKAGYRWKTWRCRHIPVLLSGVPDYFDRNKISSGGDLSHYSSASLY